MSKRCFDGLNENEKKTVKKHYDWCMNDNNMECCKLHKNIEEFWEAHKTEDYPDWK